MGQFIPSQGLLPDLCCLFLLLCLIFSLCPLLFLFSPGCQINHADFRKGGLQAYYLSVEAEQNTKPCLHLSFITFEPL